MARDVAAHDQDGAHLGAGTTKTRQNPGQQADPPIPQQGRHGTQAAGTKALQMFAVFVPDIRDHRTRQRHHDGQDQHRLRKDHRLGREQERKITQRAGARQHQINDQTRNNRRQAHERIEQNNHSAAPWKTRQGQGRAQGKTDRACHQNSRQCHAQRQANDLHQRGIGGQNEAKRGCEWPVQMQSPQKLLEIRAKLQYPATIE